MSTNNWGTVQGNTSSDKIEYVKLKPGKQAFRVVSGILPRYVYWLKNKDGKDANFDCLRFDRNKEKFVPGKDPIQDMGIMEPKPVDGKKIPLKCKKNYVCWVIDRADNKLKILTVKDGIFKGIKAVMSQLEITNPAEIDIVVERTGSNWNEVEYKVQEIAAMKFLTAVKTAGTPEFNQHAADEALLGEDWVNVKSLEETYPLMSYKEQRDSIEAFMAGRSSQPEDNGAGTGAEDPANDQEAVSDLDD